ncbi:hypothetical protein CBOM_08051 [Ceraceosorus bombacis]|uniref:Uncharacterized protein n=1 Tax=Ceraceosorus bombacis TaxID=401625 RepID=A0A0P1BJU0_9BASI|nr:hypothetical protein CBOM_08051 [Ceraceosorus bombacis]
MKQRSSHQANRRRTKYLPRGWCCWDRNDGQRLLLVASSKAKHAPQPTSHERRRNELVAKRLMYREEKAAKAGAGWSKRGRQSTINYQPASSCRSQGPAVFILGFDLEVQQGVPCIELRDGPRRVK